MTAAATGVYDAVSESDGVAVLDQPALQLAIRLRTPGRSQVMTAFTHLGGPLGMTLIAGAITATMVLVWRSWTPLILLGIGVSGSLLFTTVGKAIVGRNRPPLDLAVPPYEYAFSFPSGHTLNSTVIAGLVAYLVCLHLRRGLTRASVVIAAALWSLAMGTSRIFLGHHWLTDVLYAWLVGLAWLTLLITAHQLVSRRAGTRKKA